MQEKIEKTNFAKWHFKTTCHPNKGLLVKTRRQSKKTKKPLLHPLKRTPEKWLNLFELNEGYICGQIFIEEEAIKELYPDNSTNQKNFKAPSTNEKQINHLKKKLQKKNPKALSRR